MSQLPTTNDAAGGAGSLTQSLLNIAVNGLSRAVDGTLAKKYPLTSFNELTAVNAQGQIKPKSAPQANTTAAETLAGLFANPIFVAVGSAAAIGLIVWGVVKIASKR